MFSRVLLSFLLSSLALCLAADDVKTTTEANEDSVLSESAILLTVSACSAGSVLLVIIPSLIYHKLIRRDMYDEVF